MEDTHIFVRFLELIQKHFREQNDIAFYAEELNVEPDELSRIIWKKSDSNFSEWLKTID